MALKPEVPWNYDVPGAVCELRLPRIALRHRVVLKQGQFCVLVREKDGEVWCLARKKSLDEAKASIIWYIQWGKLWNGQWQWNPRELRCYFKKPDWL